MNQVPQYKDEIDWKDLIRNPEKLFGFSYLYVFIILSGIGLFYIWNLNYIGSNLISPQADDDSSRQAQDIPLRSPRFIPPTDVTQASISTPVKIEKGHELFKANCSACHGEAGRGDGPSALMMSTKPRNFHSIEGWVNGPRISQMYKTLEEGIAGTGMPAYNYMTPADRFAIIHFIRTFYPDQTDDTPEALKKLDETYKLALGMNIAGQIPVKKALRLVEQEKETAVKNIRKAVVSIQSLNSPDAQIFRQVVFDQTMVLASAGQMNIKNISENDFIKTITANPSGMGFKPNVVMLSGKEWSALHRFLISITL